MLCVVMIGQEGVCEESRGWCERRVGIAMGLVKGMRKDGGGGKEEKRE